MSKLGRNDACPCGSGKKYKNCHLGQPLVPDGDGIAPPMNKQERRAKAAIPALVLMVVLGLLGALWKGGTGLGVGAALGLFAGIGFVMMQNPPPPSDRSSGSAINFGN